MRLPFCYPRYFFVAVLLLGLVVILPTIIHLHFEIDPYLAGSNPIRFFDPERDDLLDEDPGQSTDSTTLDLFEQDAGEGPKESEDNVDQNSESRDTANGVKDAQSDNDGNTGIHENNVTIATTEEMSGLSDQGTLEEDNERLYTLSGTKEKIWEMEDQLIMAKAYLASVPKASNTHLRLELKLRTRDIEKALSQANKSSDFSMSALQIIRATEATLSKAHRAYPDCSERAYKIRASLEKKEEELRTVHNELLNLVRVASTALPKGIQCLSLRLTLEYFTSNLKDHKLPDRHKVQKPYLHHYAVFSGNVLACAVVVNSTISSSQEPEKIVFHVVTDSLNFPAMTMWFLLNPPTPATIDILIWDNYEQLAGNFSPTDELVGIRDPAYTSTVNHLQFFLPNHFPFLHKILVLDHDVVVQRDLSWLWRIDMEGKVTCAVKMCNHQLEELLDFTDPILSSSFDPQACVLAFGMNMFDLNEWRKQGLTTRYGNWLQKGIARRIQTGEGWPLAQLVFYNHTAYLDPGWHVLGLGNDMNVRKEEIKKAAVIHYSGTRKPWLDSAIREYKNYWDKYLNYNNPSLQKCHVHNN